MELPSAPRAGSVSAPSSAPSPEAVARATPAPQSPPVVATQPSANQATQTTQARQPTQQELQRAVNELQRKAQSFAPNLKFSVDHDTGRTVVKVTDANTQEVIRQIPAEEVLKLAKELDRMQGLLFHRQA